MARVPSSKSETDTTFSHDWPVAQAYIATAGLKKSCLTSKPRDAISFEKGLSLFFTLRKDVESLLGKNFLSILSSASRSSTNDAIIAASRAGSDSGNILSLNPSPNNSGWSTLSWDAQIPSSVNLSLLFTYFLSLRKSRCRRKSRHKNLSSSPASA